MKRIRGLAMLLALTVLLGTPAWASEPVLPRQEHMEISMEELESQTFVMDEFRTLCDTIMEQCTERANLDSVTTLVQELRSSYLLMDTELTICALNSSKHAADAGAQAAYLTKLDQSYEVERLMGKTMAAVAAGPCIQAVDQNDPVLYQFLWETESVTEEEQQFYLEEQTLVDRYYTDSQGPFTAQIDGKDYTEAEAYTAYLQGDLSWEQYDQAALEIAMDQNAALADTYLALVENRKHQAEWYGYRDYAQMADETVYYRDYTRGEITAFSQAVKTYIVPLIPALESTMQEYASLGFYDESYSTEQLLAMLRQGLEHVSGELLDAADYMTEYGYYDIDTSPDKAEGAYTTILTYPNAPYLLMQPENGPWDLSTLVHEFGHYNAFFCSDNVYAANYDLSEIHSQGLELLMTHAYDTLFGDRAEAMELYTLYSVLISLVDGCMMDELERYAYAQEDLTVEQLNRKYMELMKAYGYREQDDPAQEGYSWVLTAHLYSHPLYYISYAVSAAGAFALWEQSLTDWDGAVETYLRLVAQGETGDFFPTLQRVGMGNPISPASVETLSALVRQELTLKDDAVEGASVVEPGKVPGTDTDLEQFLTAAEQIQKNARALLGQSEEERETTGALKRLETELPIRTLVPVAVGLLVTVDVVVLVVILTIRRKEKRNHDKTGD